MRQNYSKRRKNTWRAIFHKMKIANLRDIDFKNQPHRLSKQQVHGSDHPVDISVHDRKQLLAENDSYDD